MPEYLTNFLKETSRALKEFNKTPIDVHSVVLCYKGTPWALTWSQFEVLAEDVFYNKSFGNTVVNSTLKIVGLDWWLERMDYDGEEWWKYQEHPLATDVWIKAEETKPEWLYTEFVKKTHF